MLIVDPPDDWTSVGDITQNSNAALASARTSTARRRATPRSTSRACTQADPLRDGQHRHLRALRRRSPA